MPKPTRYYSDRQEKIVAKKLGGNQTPNSGATPFYKGDVVADMFLLECKTCTQPKKSISVKKDWLDKLREESIGMNKHHSSLVFDFGTDERFYILSEKEFIRYFRFLQEEERNE